jgi:hypothetical protein
MRLYNNRRYKVDRTFFFSFCVALALIGVGIATVSKTCVIAGIVVVCLAYLVTEIVPRLKERKSQSEFSSDGFPPLDQYRAAATKGQPNDPGELPME